MAHDTDAPAANHEHTFQKHPAPAAFARQLFGRLAEVHGTGADLYLAKVIAELFELSPIALEHISDLLLVEVTEELCRRGEPGRDAALMVAEVQRDWTQGR